RRRSPTAPRIAEAVLVPVGVVGVAGAELALDGAIVLAAVVGVAHQQRQRRAGGDALVHAAQDLALVRLAPRRGMAGLAGGASRQVVGEVVRRDGDAGRAAVDHAAYRRTVRLAEGGDAEQMAEGVQDAEASLALGWRGCGPARCVADRPQCLTPHAAIKPARRTRAAVSAATSAPAMWCRATPRRPYRHERGFHRRNDDPCPRHGIDSTDLPPAQRCFRTGGPVPAPTSATRLRRAP